MNTFYAFAFSSWKKKFLGHFFEEKIKLVFKKKPILTSLQKIPDKVNIVIWANLITPEILDLSQQKKCILWRMEDGFIRSVGLGVDLTRPLSLVLDNVGIYYDATAPSKLENILNNADHFSDELLKHARDIQQKLIKLKLSKYNVGFNVDFQYPQNKTIILVPGQVETDASVLKSCFEINTNLELLKMVRKENPGAFIIYKPHPDVVAGSRHGDIKESIIDWIDIELTDGNMADILIHIDEVHTMTSLTGFEALLRGIKVVTYGLPFYAGWGLTQDYYPCFRRTKKLSIHQLIAATLIQYPTYIHPLTNQICSIDIVIDFLAKQKESQKSSLSLKVRLIRLFKKYLKKDSNNEKKTRRLN